MIESVLIAGAILLFSKRKNKSANIGKLFGKRTTRGEVKKMIKDGRSINVNNGDILTANKGSIYYYDSYNNMKTINIHDRGKVNKLINETYYDNDKQIRWDYNNDNYFDINEREWDFNDAYDRDNTFDMIYWYVIDYIAQGGKFAWEDKINERGVRMLYGLSSYFKNSRGEKNNLRKILSEDGIHLERMIDNISISDGNISLAEEAIIDAIQDATSQKKARELINLAMIEYYENNRYYLTGDKKTDLPF